MRLFYIYETLSGAEPERYGHAKTMSGALSGAIDLLQTAGVTSYLVHRQLFDVTFTDPKTGKVAAYITAEQSQAETVRQRRAVPPISAPPPEVKLLVCAGRPPDDGWYKCGNCTELDMVQAHALIPIRDAQYYLVYMSAERAALGYVHLDGLREQAVKMLKNARMGTSIELTTLAKQKAYIHITQNASPAGAVAAFILYGLGNSVLESRFKRLL